MPISIGHPTMSFSARSTESSNFSFQNIMSMLTIPQEREGEQKEEKHENKLRNKKLKMQLMMHQQSMQEQQSL